MKISETWLRQWVNPSIDSKTLASQLTMAGLEVDSVKSVASEFTGVVVGEVLERAQHPNADRLSVCKVDVGSDRPLNIVCGAKNVRQGLKVPVAKIGAVLPGNFKIQAAALRGEPSEGMICSEKELGIASESQGIMELPLDAPVGQNFRDYFQLDDQIIEIELTPNRGDCLSVRGIAREIGAINALSVQEPKIQEKKIDFDSGFSVRIEAGDRCPRYCGRLIRNINNAAKTPLWMQENLRRSDIRSINPVVDVCNYVMLEWGQPMHGFDAEKIKGEIIVRLSKPGEEILLLNEEKIQLNNQTLVIADAETPLAIAGIMGGLDSSVTEMTSSIFLESAFFDPVGVRQDAKSYHLSSDSSYRFERGVDFDLQRKALERATQLLLEIVGGEVGKCVEVEIAKALPRSKKITLRKPQIKRILGVSLEDDRVENIFKSLGFEWEKKDFGWEVKIPSHRFDLEIEADLIEELARIYGYDHIPAVPARPFLQPLLQSENHLSKSRLENYFLDRGFHEVVSYSFVDPKLQGLLDPENHSPPLSNPLSADMSVMRSRLLPGLLKTWSYNANRQVERLKIFEMGLVFKKQAEHWEQSDKLGILMAGPLYPEQWGVNASPIDFFDLKNELMGIFRLLKLSDSIDFKPSDYAALHPGQSADIYCKDQKIGYLGSLHPQLLEALDFSTSPWVAELDLELLKMARLPQYLALSKFPSVRRDLALVLEKSLPIQEILQAIKTSGGEWLQEAQLFDVYEGEHIESGKKSIAIGLTFVHPSRTLIEQEINEIIQVVLRDLELSFNATLRA